MKDWKYHCSVLGVREGATPKDVRHAYRRLALERHPDKHNNSMRSKEDFQKLHESYQFLLDALENGGRPAPAPPPPSHVDREAPTSPGIRMPTLRRNTAPARVGGREPATGRAAWKMWLNALAAGFAILTLSIWVELAHDGDSKPTHAPAAAPRDLAARSWCLISKPGAGTAHEAFEYWPESVCHENCESAVKNDRAAQCSWNGVVFRGAPVPAPAAEAQAPTIAPPSCQITVERELGKPITIAYSGVTEEGCTKNCYTKGDLEPRAGLVCMFGTKEVGRQARYLKPAEPEARTAEAAPPAWQETEVPRESRSIALDSTTVKMASVCFFSSLAPDDMITEQFQGETEEGCIQRCISTIKKNRAASMEREVRCTIFGKEVVTYVPTEPDTYAKRNLAAAEAAPAEPAAPKNCDVYLISGDVRIKAATGAKSTHACENSCRDEFAKAGHGSTVTCSLDGTEFFRKDAP